MRDDRDMTLYIGKAKDLHKRVASYFRKHQPSNKTKTMMRQVQDIEVTLTNTEAEALLLENNLIKEHKPRYNILLRDDKSYPYIRITTDDEFPRIVFYRGTRKQPGRYFGPYPSAGAVRDTLNLLHKLFHLRQCDNNMFKHRSRPCLQYQIKRCSAPCVGLVSRESYKDALDLTVQFLSGNSKALIKSLVNRMDTAADQQEYESAARYRDQVELLRKVSERQYVSAEKGDLDIIACALKGSFVCVQVFNVRGGLNIGNRAYYPTFHDTSVDESVLLTAFIGQYYLSRNIPREIILSCEPDDKQVLQLMLAAKSGHTVKLVDKVRSDKRKWLAIAIENAVSALEIRMASKASIEKQLLDLQAVLQLPEIPMRMECFDVSHIMGEATVASCVVFSAGEPLKHEYRRFNINGLTKGDDYAAMKQALERRYRRLLTGEYKMPDILFIDGGKGQLNVAREVLNELGVEAVRIVAIAKGVERKPGMETLFLADDSGIKVIIPDTGALYLIQKIRDEAHRFALAGHRQSRAKKRSTSPLEDLPGLGPKRRQKLIKYFGGLRGVNRASVEELSTVPGISVRLAGAIYERLHIQ